MLNRTPLFDAHVSAGATMVDFGGWEMPIFAVSLARFGVSFADEKGDFVGRAPLLDQKKSGTERKVVAISLTDRGVIRAGMEVYQGDKHIGWVTSGTMVPYYEFDGDTMLETTGKRSIGFALLREDIVAGDTISVDIRGRAVDAVVVAKHINNRVPPVAIPVVYGE